MQMFNQVAGFSLGEADIVRRAMSKKKLAVLTDPHTNYKARFIDGLMKCGGKAAQAEELWEELMEFAKYAFNKSHAAAYAWIAYMTAYLKHHYPAEYMCSVMARSASNKMPMLIAECTKLGLTVHGPDINNSETHFTNTGNDVLYGLGDIKGVAAAGERIVEERGTYGKYRSLKDFMLRTYDGDDGNAIVNKTAVESLIRSGSLDAFCGGNREAMLEVVEPLSSIIKNCRNKRQEMLEAAKDLQTASEPREIKKLQQKISSRQQAISGLENRIYTTVFNITLEEDRKKKLEEEKARLGFYVSGHPLDDYKTDLTMLDVTDIIDVSDGACMVCGIISEFMQRERKKDGKPLGFFKLIDRTGEINIKCWTKEFSKYKNLIADDAVVVIHGTMRTEREMTEDGTEIIIDSGITVKKMERLIIPDFSQIMISVPFITEWQDKVFDEVRRFEHADGLDLIVHDQMLDQVRKADFKVSEGILSIRMPGVFMSKV